MYYEWILGSSNNKKKKNDGSSSYVRTANEEDLVKHCISTTLYTKVFKIVASIRLQWNLHLIIHDKLDKLHILWSHLFALVVCKQIYISSFSDAYCSTITCRHQGHRGIFMVQSRNLARRSYTFFTIRIQQIT